LQLSCTIRSVTAEPGLRERKKQRTRETIARVALELFLERGFHATTIRQIADAADVAPRTVSLYFPVKEELVFPDHQAIFASLGERLEERAPDESTAAALRSWLGSLLDAHDAADHERDRRVRALVDADAALRTYERGLQERGELVVARAVAVDLGLPEDDLLPHMVGAATVAALDALGRRAAGAAADDWPAQAMSLIDDAMTFVGAGVDALAARAR
jgi:AcrR family transcriptional regulator